MFQYFKPYNVFFALAKSYTFAFIISSISAFYGYYVKGGALEIGRASTKSVVVSCVLILFADYVLVSLLLIIIDNTMIEVKNLKKGFGGKMVINDVDAVFETGKCNLIIGSSGSGKTVLMKCLVGLFEPDAGEIIYSGKNFTAMNEEEQKDTAAADRHAVPGLCFVRQHDGGTEYHVSAGYVYQR